MMATLGRRLEGVGVRLGVQGGWGYMGPSPIRKHTPPRTLP